MAEGLSYFEMMGRTGITGHLGGPDATKRLIAACDLPDDAYVLDLGCGTGWTACYLAKRHGATVVAADATPSVLDWARRRIHREGLDQQVRPMVVEAQSIPYPAQTFDVVVAESVLVFSTPSKVAAEIYRVLRPGGKFGGNEIVRLGPVPKDVQSLLERSPQFGIQPIMRDKWEWCEILRSAGFIEVVSSVARISMLEVSFTSPLRVEGPRRYLAGMLRSLTDPELRSFVFSTFRRGMWKASRLLLSSMGYALLVARK